MRLFVDVKPVKKVSRTKYGVSVAGRSIGFLTYSDTSNGAMSDRENVYGVNYEKHRKKIVDGKFVEGYWVGYVYKFPNGLLRSLNLRVVQNKRNFRLEKMK